MQTTRNELTQEVALCDATGGLNPAARGWSRRPLHVCNLKGRFLRKKRWDYWCILGDGFAFSVTVAQVDYAAIGAIYLLEYETKRYAEQTVAKPFARKPILPETISGPVNFAGKGLRIAFVPCDAGLRMAISSKDFGGRPLTADLTIERPPDLESLNVVVPWNDRTFQFTSKQHCLPANGTLAWGDETLALSRQTAFATLDYGRGIWPYHSRWNWAAFSGWCGRDMVGLNMGAQWTDGTGMNENGIILNGQLHKIFDEILFTYDPSNFMAPWTMKTAESNMVDLQFTPFFDRAATSNLLILRSSAHQMFGRYSGQLNVAGRTINIRNLPGWAEEHVARW